jgi:hypothetical protein
VAESFGVADEPLQKALRGMKRMLVAPPESRLVRQIERVGTTKARTPMLGDGEQPPDPIVRALRQLLKDGLNPSLRRILPSTGHELVPRA